MNLTKKEEKIITENHCSARFQPIPSFPAERILGAAEKKIDSADLRKISRLKGEHLGLDRIKEMD